MTSDTPIVIELQRLALDGTGNVADLVRKALFVATKLNLSDFKEWAERELNGYKGTTAEFPAYRVVKGQLKTKNPYHGYVPFIIEDRDMAEKVERATIANSIAEMDTIVKGDHAFVEIGLDPRLVAHFLSYTHGLPVVKHIPISFIVGILDSVRNTVLQWAMRLETEGILGEGMRFSEEEKKKAAEVANVHVMNIGNITGGQIQQGTHGSTQTGTFTFGTADVTELRNILGQIAEKLPTIAALTHDEKQEARGYIDAVEKSLEKPTEQAGFIKLQLGSLKSVLEIATGDVAGAVTLALLKGWMNAHGIPV